MRSIETGVGQYSPNRHAELTMLEQTSLKSRRDSETEERPRRRRKVLDLVENSLIRRLSYKEYRDKVRDVYGGPQGALLAAASVVSLHIPMGERLFRRKKFSLEGDRKSVV